MQRPSSLLLLLLQLQLHHRLRRSVLRSIDARRRLYAQNMIPIGLGQRVLVSYDGADDAVVDWAHAAGDPVRALWFLEGGGEVLARGDGAQARERVAWAVASGIVC